MKIIAVSKQSGYSWDRTLIVEMTHREVVAVTGLADHEVQIGATADPVALLRVLVGVRYKLDEARKAAGGFRALADLTDQCCDHAAKATMPAETTEAQP